MINPGSGKFLYQLINSFQIIHQQFYHSMLFNKDKFFPEMVLAPSGVRHILGKLQSKNLIDNFQNVWGRLFNLAHL
jgi:hypothetical protein